MKKEYIFLLSGIAVGIVGTLIISHHAKAKPTAVSKTETKSVSEKSDTKAK